MAIFGFGSSNNNDNNNNNTQVQGDDLYSPSGNASFSEQPSFDSGADDNSYEKMPDFMSNVQYDTAKLHPLAVQGGIDFLQVEDPQQSASFGGGATFTPSRGWTDDLCYGTGTVYLSGLAFGGAVGLAEGLKKSATTPNFRVKLNTTLNTITRRGPGLGNSVGVIAMMYNGTTAIIDATRGTHDIFNSVAAGAISGAIFKSTAGPRAIAFSSGVCAVAAGAWSFLSDMFKN